MSRRIRRKRTRGEGGERGEKTMQEENRRMNRRIRRKRSRGGGGGERVGGEKNAGGT